MEDWPVYGQRAHLEKPGPESDLNFYVESRDLYVDFPNHSLTHIFEQIFHVQEEHPDDPDDQLAAAKDIAAEATEAFHTTYGEYSDPWLWIVVADRMARHGYFAIRINRDWSTFAAFLDAFAAEGGALNEKSRYLQDSRHVAVELASREADPTGHIIRIQEAVCEHAEPELEQIERNIHELQMTLQDRQSELFTYSQRKTVLEPPTVLQYMMEARTILSSVTTLSSDGVAPSCYRELRKLLENLCWGVFDDLLRRNAVYYEYFQDNRIVEGGLAPYQHLNQPWYEWDDSALRRYGDVKEKIHKIRNELHTHLRDTGYDIPKGEITVTVRDLMSSPLFIALTGTITTKAEAEQNEIEQFVRPWSPDELRPLVRHTLHRMLREAKGTNLYKKDNQFLDSLAEHVIAGDESIVIAPAFPSNAFVIDYVNRVFNEPHIDLSAMYSDYSYFVHSYSGSWQVYPFSSVLEFKILRHEIGQFRDAVEHLLNDYIGRCY